MIKKCWLCDWLAQIAYKGPLPISLWHNTIYCIVVLAVQQFESSYQFAPIDILRFFVIQGTRFLQVQVKGLFGVTWMAENNWSLAHTY